MPDTDDKPSRTLIGHIREVKVGQDFQMYEEKFAQYCQANEINGSRRIAMLINKSYDKLCTLLREHNTPPKNTFRERIQFYQAVQGNDETCSEWYARIKRLSIECKFTDIEAVLKDKFVSGLRPGLVLDKIVESPVTDNLKSIVDSAVAKETAIKAASNSNSETKPILCVRGDDTYPICNVEGSSMSKLIILKVKLEGNMLEKLLDSGSPISAINKSAYDEYFSHKNIEPTNHIFDGYQGDSIIPIGHVGLNVEFKGTLKLLKFFVIESGQTNLIGRDFMQLFNINLAITVVEGGLGTFKYAKVTLKLKTGTIPRHSRPLPVPMGLKPKVETE
ncbi:hypothetical protein ILUMI_23735 [Ignelater luminosus]|uniref:Peptidase A2 domain-containing protein n=1 Tax=Ignelater luminosus TaxID=2038154 RepID=A0A8K0CDC4_IGNLU|nr:hypothetical protein ILUMI_23735 [Ignelater luminosus]